MSRKGIKNFTTDAERRAAEIRRKQKRKEYLARLDVKARIAELEILRAPKRRAYAKRRNLEKRELVSSQQKKFRATARGRASHLINAARKRSKISGLEVSVPHAYVEWALIAGVCARTGIKFDFGTYGTRAPFAPSLDRKDSTKGYTLENTEVVCNAFNLGKNEWGYDVLATWAEAMRKQQWYLNILHQR